ncbi:hypothetical protein ACFO3J_14635 [Streptomyces polygonati]|uniref:Integral membrane protein n=1 Tax=Streptomyces polygonati TaxID=1617087 RepID=A0ABV8HQX6_9ACTN
MNRWLVRRFVRMRNRVAAYQPDRGQGAIEYLGLAVVIAVIIGILSQADIGNAIFDGIMGKIGDIVGG